MMPRTLSSSGTSALTPDGSVAVSMETESGEEHEAASAATEGGRAITRHDDNVRDQQHQHQECKSNEGQTISKPKDSPAFRLRPRRSIPKTCSSFSGSPGRPPKISIFSRHSNFFTESSGGKGLDTAKRKLLQYLSHSGSKSSDDDTSQDRDAQASMSSSSSAVCFTKPCLNPCRSILYSCPANSVKHEVDLGIFLSRIHVPSLTSNRTYEKNYVSLRIIHILSPKIVQPSSLSLSSLASPTIRIASVSPTATETSPSSGIITRRKSHEGQQQNQQNKQHSNLLSPVVVSNGLLAVVSPSSQSSSSLTLSPQDSSSPLKTTLSPTSTEVNNTVDVSSISLSSWTSNNQKNNEGSHRRCNDDNAQDGKIFDDHQTEQENREHASLLKRRLSTDKTLTPPKILVIDEQEEEDANGQTDIKDSNRKKHLEILVQDADASHETSNWKDPCVRVCIEGEYADALSILEVGNVIEVTKFTVEDSSSGVFNGNQVMSSSCHVKLEAGDEKSGIQVLPFNVVIRDPSTNESIPPSPSLPTSFVNEGDAMETTSPTPAVSACSHTILMPFVSIKKRFCSLDNPLLLKVNLFGKKPEVPSPGLRFTSKVIKKEEIPGRSSDQTEMKERPASRMMTRRSCSSSSTSPLSSPMTSRCSGGGGGKTRRSQAQILTRKGET